MRSFIKKAFFIKKAAVKFCGAVALLFSFSAGGALAENVVTAVTLDPSVTGSNVLAESYAVQTIASFTTEFTAYETGRNANIALAAKALNGVYLKPGDIFSFNDTIGPTTEANGFKLAKIFIDGEESEGYGGGVCQVSSTLFNTAELAGMEILERHPHTKRVYYVEEGRDAATSYGKIDFKFKNTAAVPVRISTLVKETFVTINLDALI
ncbi:MAG: VanW family protein [Clostridiales bacterium]|nr:VanW family protein [Clostridiales bacterium]